MKQRVMYRIIAILLLMLPAVSWGQSQPPIGVYIVDSLVNPQTCEICYKFDYRGNGGGWNSTNVQTAFWDFGDGNTTTVNGYNPPNQTHCYANDGTYTVTLTITSTANQSYTYISQPLNAVGNSGTGALPTFTISGTSPTYSFEYTGLGFPSNIFDGTNTYLIDFGDNSNHAGTSLSPGQTFATHTYPNQGAYTATLTHTHTLSTGEVCEKQYSVNISVSEDPCCSNFAPEPGERYWLSAWVMEDHPTQQKTYSDAFIELEFTGAPGAPIPLRATGEIIDGWQRIVGDFTVPTGATELKIHLVNGGTGINAFFDDIRVHPFNASMKSYVYDPETLWLTAELDDNNYATFYEYDKEGQLIRIKKETARGIMTIQESRSSNPKKDNP